VAKEMSHLHLYRCSLVLTANFSTEGAAKKLLFWENFDRIQMIAHDWMGSAYIGLKSRQN
jgi:hypothetical protein